MNFRQRCAWLCLLLYMCSTITVLHYIFDISDQYNQMALDHTDTFHTDDMLISTWHHLVDIPLYVWILIIMMPYLQIFLLLLAYTKSEPRLSLGLMWPRYVYLLLTRCVTLNKIDHINRVNVTLLDVITNHPIIDT